MIILTIRRSWGGGEIKDEILQCDPQTFLKRLNILHYWAFEKETIIVTHF